MVLMLPSLKRRFPIGELRNVRNRNTSGEGRSKNTNEFAPEPGIRCGSQSLLTGVDGRRLQILFIQHQHLGVIRVS